MGSTIARGTGDNYPSGPLDNRSTALSWAAALLTAPVSLCNFWKLVNSGLATFALPPAARRSITLVQLFGEALALRSAGVWITFEQYAISRQYLCTNSENNAGIDI